MTSLEDAGVVPRLVGERPEEWQLGVLTVVIDRDGDRVALVDLRAELRCSRAQFAWDFARLRRERRLVVDGRRVDLGIATGHATARRSRVVWLEDDGGGAYYATFRLAAQEAR